MLFARFISVRVLIKFKIADAFSRNWRNCLCFALCEILRGGCFISRDMFKDTVYLFRIIAGIPNNTDSQRRHFTSSFSLINGSAVKGHLA